MRARTPAAVGGRLRPSLSGCGFERGHRRRAGAYPKCRAIRFALRCLIAHCPERWPLDMFWNSAGTDHDIGRAQGCTAALNGIIRQLEADPR